MKNVLRGISLTLLILVGITAVVGGGSMVNNPNGHTVHLPLSILEGSVFPNFMWPGYILFLVVGLGSLFVAYITYLRELDYPNWILAWGIVLFGWLTAQLAITQHFFAPLHLTYYLISLSLGVVGYALIRMR
jgi:drug/metabolite transporter (DMT)-like permease